MEVLEHLGIGFATACTPTNLLFCFLGVFLGTLIGVLPGVGPVPAIALLLPFTFSLSPTTAVIMLAGIYYGSQYGGSITAILINLPGEAASTVTCLDGHAMARSGRAGFALTIAALASFVGGTLATLVVAVLSAPLAAVANHFEAADYVGLMTCGLAAAIILAHGSVLNAIAMVVLGLFLGTVGTDVTTEQPRMTFGRPELLDGIGFVPLAIGFFGFSEVIHMMVSAARPAEVLRLDDPRWRPGELRRSWWATVRGTFVGAGLGVLPGGGPLLASFASYAVEKKLARSSTKFGEGAVEGVAGPEAANNAAAQTSFIPLLTLGLPANPVMALFVGALLVHGIQPGPGVITQQSALFWGLIVSMWIGNLILLVLNLPLVGLWASLLRVPQRFLLPATLVLSCVGVYSINHRTFDLLLAAGFGAVGYVLRRCGCEPAVLLLGFILSQPLEENLHRALMFADGDPTFFLTRPSSASLLVVAVLALAVSLLPRIARARRAL